MGLPTSGPVIVGHIGLSDTTRVRGMAARLGGVPELLNQPGVLVHARGGRRGWSGEGASWSHAPLPPLTDDSLDLSDVHDAVSVHCSPERTVLRGSVSGALPLYVDTRDDAIVFSSRLDVLVDTYGGRSAADLSGLLEMVAASGPLAGRTAVVGINRLGPGEMISRDRVGEVRREQQWAWPGVEFSGSTVEDLMEVLRTELGRLARDRPLISMLSGGWDSRLLLALALHAPRRNEIRAFTTSSDTGTVMEELVAAQVAEHLGVDHRVVMPRRDEFAADLDDFAEAVGYQTAFHVWLVPLARAIAQGAEADVAAPAAGRQAPTVLDGLGGGLFVGGAFADDSSGRPISEQRLAGITRYLGAAGGVLHPAVARQALDRIRADAEPVVQRYLDHPFGHTFTAYVTRTLPGISLAPHGLMARIAHVATPFLAPGVVTTALGMRPAEHADGRLYALLMAGVDPVLGGLATAQEQVPWPRPHPRRVTSTEAIRRLRALLLREPVRALVAPGLIDGGPSHWREVLSTTGGQHLVRGLAVLSLWCERHDGLVGLDLQELTR